MDKNTRGVQEFINLVVTKFPFSRRARGRLFNGKNYCVLGFALHERRVPDDDLLNQLFLDRSTGKHFGPIVKDRQYEIADLSDNSKHKQDLLDGLRRLFSDYLSGE